MLRSSLSVVLIVLLGLTSPFQVQAAAQKKKATDPVVVPGAQTNASSPTPRHFISADAQTCWEAFGPQAPTNSGSEAVEACRRATATPYDALSARLLGVAYLNGLHGLQRNKPEGLRLLSSAVRAGIGGCPGIDPASFLYLGLLLWQGDAWFNTDTHSEEPMNPGDRESYARKAIRMMHGRSYVHCAATSHDPQLSPVAHQMEASMQSPIVDHYNPTRDGDSSTHFHAYQSQYNTGGSTGSSTDALVAVAGAFALLTLIGAATSGDGSQTNSGSGVCTITLQTHTQWVPNPSGNGGSQVTQNRIRPGWAPCTPTY